MQKRYALWTPLIAAMVAVGCGSNGSSGTTGNPGDTAVTDPSSGSNNTASSPSTGSSSSSTGSSGSSTGGTTTGSGTASPGTGTSTGSTTGSTAGGTTSGGTQTGTTVADLAPTYQKPAQYTTHSVTSSNSGGSPTMTAYSYTIAPATSAWSALQTVPYPVVDLHDSSQLATGNFTDANGETRMGYRFTIAPGDSPDWGGSPRVEFDSANGGDQNPSNGMPNSAGWSKGLVLEGSEMWFSWSMYLDANFSLNQQWATLFQLHAGNTNYDGSSPLNGWPNPGWPGINVEKGAIAFGLGPDATSPGQVWTGNLADYRGKWTDIAIHAKFSAGSDGLLEFYLNGKKVGTKTGANMVYVTTGGTPRWYYMKQGFYRASNATTTDTVYQTPILVSAKL